MQDIDAIANGNSEVFKDLFEKKVKNVIRNNEDMLYSKFWENQ